MELDIGSFSSDAFKLYLDGSLVGTRPLGDTGSLNKLQMFDSRASGSSSTIFIDDISIAPFVAGVDGDFDGDLDVDGADFLKWQRELGDAANLALWEGNFGTTAAAAAAASVPEPASWILVCTMAMATIRLRRRS